MAFQSPGRFLPLSYVHSTGCQRPGAAPKRQHCMTEAALAGGLSGSRWKCSGQGSADPSQCLELSPTQTHALTNALHTYTYRMHTDTCIPYTHHTHTYRACSLTHTHTPTHPHTLQQGKSLLVHSLWAVPTQLAWLNWNTI